MAALMVSATAVVGAALFMFGPRQNVMGQFVFVALLALIALTWLRRAIAWRRESVYLFEGGFVRRRTTGGVEGFCWSDIVLVREKVRTRTLVGQPTAPAYSYTVRRSDGAEVELGNVYVGVASLGETVMAHAPKGG